MSEAVDHNITDCDIEITQFQMNFYEHYSWWLGGIASIVLATFGLLFNTISVYILCDRRLTSSFFNTMLACLAVVDNSFLFIRICVTMVMQFMELSPTPSEGIHLSVFIYLLHPAQSFFMTCSIYITIELAWERYTSISNPHLHHLRQMQGKGIRTFLYIMPVVMLSTIFNIPKLFERQVVETKSKVVSLQDSSWTNELGFNNNETISYNQSYVLHIFPTDLRMNNEYIIWYVNVANLMVNSIVPGVLLVFFNYKVQVYSTKRAKCKSDASKRQKESLNQPLEADSDNERKIQRYAIRQKCVLFAIVAMFFLCHALRVAQNVKEIIDFEENRSEVEKGCIPNEFWELLLVPLSDLLVQINASMNFFIYCICDYIFRNVLDEKVSRIRSFRNSTRRTAQEAIELHTT